ncbi:hypothetical protein SAMD00019534_123050 [Acytostelium subglobosum LB1]|uniref:hypothetical protein n=1 Tax=Acytostelium subglobosum LB1 TaxID=1410327 RepID=UPI000644DE61|nr:hypothetical protein SAMD00019534_123050 [Acytostelium subglobosum LB1]GAM29129.1 hypothetical protein SAMD00019534_123050 [Acytostelium subglobosum LB1]|eukprot:XP_012747974.1 hypothetical protein SAMD00019534_123050 [Acytostelium subglobosum LB1]
MNKETTTMIGNFKLPPRWHYEGRDGACCDNSCDKQEIDNEMKGPNDISNWVLKGKIMTGEYPAKDNQDDHQKLLSSLLDANITLFVCLQLETELENFKPYKQDLIDMANERNLKIEFLHFPIEDGGVAASIEELADFIDLLLNKLKDHNVYLHCWAGRGRTGIIAACLLGRLYQISGLEACRRIQECYEQRVIGFGESPEYHPQKMQVINYLKYIKQRDEQQQKQQLRHWRQSIH